MDIAKCGVELSLRKNYLKKKKRLYIKRRQKRKLDESWSWNGEVGISLVLPEFRFKISSDDALWFSLKGF